MFFIIFVLLHEIGHLLTGIVVGFVPKKFIIMPFGFKIKFKEIMTNKSTEQKKIIVAASGPILNLIIITIAIIFKLDLNIIYINLTIALFNLLPIYPLDGGRILKSLLNIKKGHISSYEITNKTSNFSIIFLTAISSIFVLYFKNISIVFAIAYLWSVVIRENKRYKSIKRIYNIIENNKKQDEYN